MRPRIRTLDERDAAALGALSLRAWAPVFASLERVLGSEIFGRLHLDWREDQRRAVEDVWTAKKERVWVAEVDEAAVGFVAAEIFDPERSIGEISVLAVDPDHQGGGIGTALRSRTRQAQRRRDEGSGGRDGRRPWTRSCAPHVREGRPHPPAHSQVLQGAVAAGPWCPLRTSLLRFALRPDTPRIASAFGFAVPQARKGTDKRLSMRSTSMGRTSRSSCTGGAWIEWIAAETPVVILGWRVGLMHRTMARKDFL